MSLYAAATNQITLYGYKGAAILNRFTVTKQGRGQVKTPTVNISLLSYVHRYPQSRINNTSILEDDRRVLIALDGDFDGTINKNDAITVNGVKLNIVNKIVHRVNEVITHVEVQARG